MAVIGITAILAAGMLAGCSGGADDNGQESQSAQAASGDSAAQSSSAASEDDGASGETQSITVSAAASLTDVLNELAEKYKEQDPGRCRHRSKRERLWICFSPQRRKIWMRWRRKA